MNRWAIEFLPAAQKDLQRLDSATKRRVIAKLDWLSENFGSLIPAPLIGEFREFFKLRVGDLRIFYKVEWSTCLILICYIDRRDKAYKK